MSSSYAAVTAPPGPLLVIAGAGSGKTRTLTYRVAYLLENGIDPRNILLLTFTNKAARQMLDRVANLLPIDASGLWGGTFHSDRQPDAAPPRQRARIYERVHHHGSRRPEGLAQLCGREQRNRSEGNPFPKGRRARGHFQFRRQHRNDRSRNCSRKSFPISCRCSSRSRMSTRATSAGKNRPTRSISMICSKRRSGCCKEHEEIAAFYRRQFQFILVDEYQDTNKIQADFIDSARRRTSKRDGGGRRRTVDLLLARREFPKHSRFPAALSERAGLQDRAELPERAGDPARSPTPPSAANVQQFRKQLSATRLTNSAKPALVALERWRRAGAVRRPADSRTAR